MEIYKNKALLIRTRNPGKYALIPGHLRVDDDTIAVRWGLDEVRVLVNLGVKNVPSPIYRNYEWPCRYPSVFAHQKKTSADITMYHRLFVLSEPGVGKTLSVLWAADYLMRVGAVRRMLVVCPLSIVHSAWMGDIARSVIHRSAIVCHHSSAEQRRNIVRGDHEIVITNYDGLHIIADAVAKDGRFDLIVADECNHLKNMETTRWKSFVKMLTPNTRVCMMTGTPAAQSPLDAYALAKVVNPDGVPKFFGGWRDLTMIKVSMHRWVPKPSAKHLVYEAMQPSIRFTKAECLDLPPVLTETRVVTLTAQQLRYYNTIRRTAVIKAAGETITAVNAAALVSKLLQISAGAAYSDGHDVVQFDCKPRLKVLTEVLEQTERKVLVFALFRSSIETIVQHLSNLGVSYGEIHGGVTSKRRATLINRFQTEDEPRVMVMQPQASAHGITLTAADTVVFYGPLMSVEQYVQCCARADRQGQTSDKVTVVHIQGSPIEEEMFKALSSKVNAHQAVASLFGEVLQIS